jgi:hypothetical protein
MYMTKKFVRAESERVIGVLIDLQDRPDEDRAVKSVFHRRSERLLCRHVYFHFCLECPQYECDRRSV